MVFRQIFATFLFISASLLSQNHVPKLEDYPVNLTFTGEIAELSPSVIKELQEIKLLNGGTPLDYIKYKPNFASKYEIVMWSCGLPCWQAVVINWETGEKTGSISYCYNLEFSLNSRLIIADDTEFELCTVEYSFLKNDKIISIEVKQTQ